MKPALHSYFLFANWLSRRGSLRTQLIAWNIALLALLLGGLGLVIRGVVDSTMMTSIDRDLEARLRHFRDPPPPRRPRRPDNPADNSSLNSSRNAPLDSDSPPFRPEQAPPQNDRGGAPETLPEFGDNPPRPQSESDSPPHRGDRDTPFPPEERLPGQNRPPAVQNTDPYRPLPLNLKGQSMERQGTRSLWDAAAFARAAKGETVHSTVVVDNTPLRILSRRFPPNGEIVGVVQTAYPLSETYRALQGLDRALLMLIPFALVCAGLGGAYLTGRVLRRVRTMTLAAEAIGAQEFSQRLPVAGNDEFANLADTFNGLLGRLEGAFKQQERLLDQQRRFTADASHELKTPLTIIKGHTSLTLSSSAERENDSEAPCHQSMKEIDRAADSMSHLVQDLLLLARSDGGQLGRRPIKLLLREVLERALSSAGTRPGANVTLSLGGSAHGEAPSGKEVEQEKLCVLGNETELVRLFANLLENAVRYTPETGSVHINALRQGAQVLVTIADTGIGIAPEHLPHLGERFYRVDMSRTRPTGGTGLGLSICKGIVEAHGGTLTFASVVGSGTTVTVTLPGA